MNALIDLVSKLKSERQYYKTQLKTLITDLRSLKTHPAAVGLSWPTTPHVPPTPGQTTVTETMGHTTSCPQNSNGFHPKSYWLADLLDINSDKYRMPGIQRPEVGFKQKRGYEGVITGYCNAGCCDGVSSPYYEQQKPLFSNKNGLDRSKTIDSLSTILTTTSSLSPNMDIAETRLGGKIASDVLTASDRAIIKADVNENSSTNTGACGEKISWSDSVNATGFNNNHNGSVLIPFSFNDQGSTMGCIKRPVEPFSCSHKSLSKSKTALPVAQRPNTLTISNHNSSSKCYTKKTQYVFYI